MIIYYENACCEVTSWGMNPAAIFATALFTPYWSCAEYALCIHKIKDKVKMDYDIKYMAQNSGRLAFYFFYRIIFTAI
jgi:hypothetical protein